MAKKRIIAAANSKGPNIILKESTPIGGILAAYNRGHNKLVYICPICGDTVTISPLKPYSNSVASNNYQRCLIDSCAKKEERIYYVVCWSEE